MAKMRDSLSPFYPLLGLSALAGGPLAFAAEPALPEHIEVRHGAVERKEGVAVEGGMTTVLQAASDSRARAELTASFDLVTTIPYGPGEWVVYVEGNLSPRQDGVSSVISAANGDAGSALDRDGNGRLQVSELHYFYPLPGALLVSGLLDTTATLDTSEVATDETHQFLSAPLVHNPTIDFPDYTLGIIYNREIDRNRGYTLLLAASNGLGDNPNASYAELLDLGADGKGVFAATEGQWQLDGLKLHGGLWTNTADHPKLADPSRTAPNYGLYFLLDGSLGRGQWNVRWGMANAEVSKAANFLSLAVEQPFAGITVGVGLAHTGLSDKDTTAQQDDATSAELYVRFSLNGSFSLSPSLQWHRNSGFDASGSTVDEDVLVYGARLSYSFE